eukprot:gene51682-62494_t
MPSEDADGRLLAFIAHFAHPDDTAEDTRRKILAIPAGARVPRAAPARAPVLCVLGPMCFGMGCMAYVLSDFSFGNWQIMMLDAMYFTSFSAIVAWIWWTKRLPNVLVEGTVVYAIGQIVVMDWITSGRLDMWQWGIVGMDCLMLMFCRPMVTFSVFAAIVAWIV